MYFTGFADEAADSLLGQIKATKELGWQNIESRNIDGKNIHDLTDSEFDLAFDCLEANNIKINCFGSAIANWAKKVDDPAESSFEEIKRAIPRMQRLGTKMIRIMSYSVDKECSPDDQIEDLRFSKVQYLTDMFLDAGIQPLHENCMNYGGQGWKYTLRLLENVKGLKLVFDTGNPVFSENKNLPIPYPKQSSWDFYSNVKEFVEYIHIKDAIILNVNDKEVCQYTWPGEGHGDVKKILKDLIGSGYDGGISIEPHLATVFHADNNKTDNPEERYNSYVEYGQRLEKLIKEL